MFDPASVSADLDPQLVEDDSPARDGLKIARVKRPRLPLTIHSSLRQTRTDAI